MMSDEQTARRSQLLAEHISEILHGQGPEAQSAALADLTAIWLAGHFIFDEADKIDRKQTDALRDELFREWIKAVRLLIKPNEQMLLERLRKDAH